jgi:cell wall-associated NlpC family hydrolase
MILNSYFCEKYSVLKKILFLLFALIFLSACRGTSPIVTTKKPTNLPKTAPISVIKTNPVQKKVRKEEPIIQEKPIVENKSVDIPLDEVATDNTHYNSSLSSEIVETAKGNLGSRYQTGGTTKSGFDCSGLMYATYGKFDIKLPRTSNEMSRFGKKINPKEAQKGDLIFFRTLGNKQINHVGMVVEVNEDEIKFIHSSIKKGVIISTTKEGYYKSAFAQVNRVLD